MTQFLPATSEALQQRQQLITAATSGDADAQSLLGDICRIGDQITDQNFSEAMRWYRLAAEQGDANARNNVGAMYAHAMGVREDMAKAAHWYRLAADQGLATAQYNLGKCCLYGTGVNVNEHEAAQWLHMAASQGHIEALSELGTMYLFGRGVGKRIAMAAEMLTVAALDGDMNALGTLADYHDQIESDAKDGSVLSALCLAKMYDRGLGVERSEAKLFMWLMWGGYKGTRDDDPDVREELIDMRGFYASILTNSVRDEAWKLVGQMWSPNAKMLDNRPRDAEGNVIDELLDDTAGNSRVGG